MSIYNNRKKPAYRKSKVDPNYAKNEHILAWWSTEHDELILELIEKYEWHWYWEIKDEIEKITEEEVIRKWRDNDPICSDYAWYNVLMYFAIARAQELVYTNRIRKPKWKTCPLCNNKFIESSLPHPLVKRLGIGRLDYCSPCLCSLIFQNSGDPNLPKDQVVDYLQNLSNVIGKVPTQGFGEIIGDLLDLENDQLFSVLKLFQNKPTTKRVKELFGSWLHALIESGVLEDGTRRTERGIQTIAKDGHICLSLGEKTIDDYLYNNGIEHEIEPAYPEGNFRADFQVGNTLIEYFGLKGNTEYDKKTELKQNICKKHDVHLISIYPNDLISKKRLEKKMSPILNKRVG